MPRFRQAVLEFCENTQKDSTGIPALKNPLTDELVTNNKEKVNLLNLQYQNQFTPERLDDLPLLKRIVTFHQHDQCPMLLLVRKE